MSSNPAADRPTEETRTQLATDDGSPKTKSRRKKFLQGAAVFLIMFVTLWWLLSRGEDSPE